MTYYLYKQSENENIKAVTTILITYSSHFSENEISINFKNHKSEKKTLFSLIYSVSPSTLLVKITLPKQVIMVISNLNIKRRSK